jgi:hypothetical protein
MSTAKVLLLVALILAIAPTEAASDGLCPGITGAMTAFADEKITVSSSAIGFTQATYHSNVHPVSLAVFSIETDSVRYRVTGPAPTSSTGHLLSAGSVGVVCGATLLANFKAIRVTSDATMQVTYYYQ